MCNLLLDSDEHVIKIVERNVNIDYSVVFKNVFDKFIDKFSRDVVYTIIHEILPVKVIIFWLENGKFEFSRKQYIFLKHSKREFCAEFYYHF